MSHSLSIKISSITLFERLAISFELSAVLLEWYWAAFDLFLGLAWLLLRSSSFCSVQSGERKQENEGRKGPGFVG